MTPKEKAKGLVEMFEQHSKPMTYGFNFSGDVDHSVECALICVDWHLKEFIDTYGDDLIDNIAYWEEVKQEINNL